MKKVKYILTIILLCIAFWALFNTNSYASFQKLDSITYDVRLNENGSVNVKETWKIEIEETNTLFKTFDLDSSKYGEITNVTVKEISKKGAETEFIKSDTYAYHVKKGYYHGLKTSSSEFEIAWGVSIDREENKIYEISYTIEDAIKNYNDCSEFYWQFIGKTNAIPADKVTGIIKLPTAVQDKENLRVWAHGPLNGEIVKDDNQTVSFKVNYLPDETMVEVRIAILEPIFMQNLNTESTDKFDTIIKEETKWADDANEERERIKKRQEKQEETFKTIAIGMIAVGLGVGIFFILKIVKYIKEIRKTKKIMPEEQIEYFREIPDENSTAAEAAYLYYFDKKTAFKNNISKIVSATILNLGLKKVISFEKDQKQNIDIVINKEIDVTKLQVEEKKIYYLLTEVEKWKNKKGKTEEGTDRISMKDIEKYAKSNDRAFLSDIDGIEVTALSANKIKQNYSKEQIEIATKWENKRTAYYVVAFLCLCFGVAIAPLFAVIPSIICGILCQKLASKTRTLTQKGVNEQEKWKALKRYMENFSLLNEREVPELVLWEKYLVYATAFGIADKVLRQLKIKYPELMDENYMMSNGYMYIYLMNRYNFQRTLTSSMQSAYSVGLREKAAREMASSSSSSGFGGGGGFSSGGGFGGGRRPEWAEDNIN